MLFGGCVATKNAEPAPQPATAEQPSEAPVATMAEAPEVEPVPLPMAPKPAPEKPKTVSKAKPAPVAEPEPASMPTLAAPAPVADSPFEKYTVELVPDKEKVVVGEPVSLRVIVKAKDFPLSGSDAHGVQVTFSGLGFVTDVPAVECLRAHPNGSEVIYNVTAMNSGTYRVTANVSVYPTRECHISSAHKTSAPIVVSVK
ncbi:MAG: hypothetical protein IE886_04395 [Campylobacterales bacterium]|nr:hypothetical protein [Campylobacterales bacterium]